MGDSKVRRDSKDPMPTEKNSARIGGGNDPAVAGGEKHGQSKAEHVSVASRFDKNKPGPEQPTRCDGNGNTPVTQAREDHGQKKAEHISAASRF